VTRKGFLNTLSEEEIMKTVQELQTERSQVLAEAEKILDLVDNDDRAMTDDE